MKAGRGGRWRRLTGEFVVIVIGVLTALTVDQWAEAREERLREADYLVRLEADLVADSLTLAQRRAQSEAGLARLGALLSDIPEEGMVDLAPYRDDSWYSFVGPATPPLPSTSTFDELISTGGLTLIRSAELRTALLEYYRMSARQAANQQRAFAEGRDPFMALGWEADVVQGTEYSRAEALVDASAVQRATRRAISYQAILARTIGLREAPLAETLALVRRSLP